MLWLPRVVCAAHLSDEGEFRMPMLITEVLPAAPSAHVWRLACLAIAILIGGCASSSTTYGPDGRQAHTLNCSGLARSWAMCAEKAGEICGPRGYDVVGAAGGSTGSMAMVSRSGGFGGSGIERSMLIQCKN
jgi:hypothetical protein